MGLVEVNAFDAYIHEDVIYCDTNDFLGGICETEIYYTLISSVDVLKIPSLIFGNEKSGQVKDLFLKENRSFKKIKALVDTSELKSNLDNSDLEIFLLGTRAELIGFKRTTNHRPLVFLLRDNNGKYFIFGTLESPAYIKDFSIETGKKPDDDTGANVKLVSNGSIFEYIGPTDIVEPPHIGDFDEDFDEDFD